MAALSERLVVSIHDDLRGVVKRALDSCLRGSGFKMIESRYPHDLLLGAILR